MSVVDGTGKEAMSQSSQDLGAGCSWLERAVEWI